MDALLLVSLQHRQRDQTARRRCSKREKYEEKADSLRQSCQAVIADCLALGSVQSGANIVGQANYLGRLYCQKDEEEVLLWSASQVSFDEKKWVWWMRRWSWFWVEICQYRFMIFKGASHRISEDPPFKCGSQSLRHDRAPFFEFFLT